MLRCEKLNIGLGNDLWFKDFSISFERGKLYLFTGYSGSGKSLLFSTVSGLRSPARGDVSFNSHSLFTSHSYDLPFVKKKLGVIFQTPAFISNLNLMQNIQVIASVKAIDPQKIVDILETHHLGKHLDKRINLLSEGQKRLLAILLNLAHEPDCIVWDDLSFMDDYEYQDEILELISKERKRGTSIVAFSRKKPSFYGDEWEHYNIRKKEITKQ